VMATGFIAAMLAPLRIESVQLDDGRFASQSFANPC
jgi:hypothetical protein